MAKVRFRPGEKAPVSGQYPIIGPRGGDTGKEVTLVRAVGGSPRRRSRGGGFGTPDRTKHKRR
jgi:hypothetical protein